MRVPSVIGRRSVAITVGLALVVMIVVVGAYRRSAGPAVDDAARVWCLADDRLPALVEAARDLGMVSSSSTGDRLAWSGGSGTVGQWRDARPGDFARTCRALIGSEQRVASGGGPSPWSTLAPSLVLAVVSAVLAGWFSSRLATAGARRVEADGLRTAAQAYRIAAERVLRELEQPRPGLAPADGEVHDRRLELATRLNAVAAAHRRWPLPRQLSESLDRDPFGAPMAAQWSAQPPPRRPDWVAGTRVALGRLEAEVLQVAGVVQDPGLIRERASVSPR